MNNNTNKIISFFIIFLVSISIANMIFGNEFSDNKNDLSSHNNTFFSMNLNRSNGDQINHHQWPGYGYDIYNTGMNPYAISENTGDLFWKLNLHGEIARSSPAIDKNGNIYIGPTYGRTNLYCIYPNGTIKWTYQNDRNIQGTPALDKNDNIYFTDYSKLVSLFPNGSFRWKSFNFNSLICSSPIISVKGDIYVGSKDRNLYCFYSNGSLKWKKTFEWRVDCEIAFDDIGNIYLSASCEVGPYSPGIIYSLYENGSIRWRVETDGVNQGNSVLIHQNTCYIASNDYASAVLFALNKDNGVERWNYTMGEVRSASPSIDSDGNIYIGTQNGDIFSINQSGGLNWKQNVGNSIEGKIVIDGNNNVYFGSRNAIVFCYHQNGSLKWKYNTGGFVLGSPAISNDCVIYIGSWDKYLYSLRSPMPNPPQNVQRRTGFRFIDIKWEDPDNFISTGVQGYRIYRNDSFGSYELVAELNKDQHHFNDTTVINGIEYYYSLVAFNNAGNGKDFFLPPIAPLSRSLEPRNLTIYPGPNLINLTWDPPLDSGGYPILYYYVYRATGSVFTLVEKSNETFYSDTSLNVNIKYHYKVSAVTEYGEGKMSDPISGMSFVVPSTPRNFSLITDDGYVDITWDKPAYDGGEPIVHYQLYRNGSEYRKLDPDAISYRDEYVVTGIKYSYQLSAFNIIGEGWKTENLTIFPLGVPGTPIGLTAELLPDGVRLTWDPPLMDGGTTVYNYSIYRSAGDSFELIDISDNLQYIDSQIDRGQSYIYYVTSTNAIGEGFGSIEVEIIIPQIDLPGTPLNVNIELRENGVVISWDRPENYIESNMEGYYVYRRIEEYHEIERIATLEETSYMDGVVQANFTYHYSVSAYNQYGESNPSDPVSILIPSGTIIGSDGDNGDDGISTILILIIIVIIVIILLSLIGILVFFLLKPARKKEEVIRNEEDKKKQPSYSDTLESLFQDQKENLSTNEGKSNDLIPGENEMI